MEDQLTLILVQSDLHWENPVANIAMFDRKLADVKPRSVVFLPEMFSTGFSMDPAKLAEDMSGPSVTWMKTVARNRKIAIGGSLIIREADNYYNRFIWALPNGQIATYDKRHLFGFAGEDEKYQSGNKRLVVSVSGWRINLMVCYDLRFPVWARQQMHGGVPEYDLLVYVANWPEKRINAWKSLLKARAIENQCFVAAVNRVGTDGNGIKYSGDSMIVDPLGDVRTTCTSEESLITEHLQKEDLEKVRNHFPFLRDADEFRIEL